MRADETLPKRAKSEIKQRVYSLDLVCLRIFAVFKCHIDIRGENHPVGHTPVFSNHFV